MRKKRKPFNRATGWQAIRLTMQSASVEPQDEDIHRWLATAAYAALEKLTGGLFDLDDHMTAVKLNTFACILAVEILPSLDDGSRAAVAVAHDATVNAAECLHQIGERHRKTGKFGATGNELTTIRESFGLLDTLVSYANRGETIRAMTKMEAMIAERMAELNRPKEKTCKSA